MAKVKITNCEWVNRLEQLQYRAAKLVVGALKYTSREKLNKELGWETIQKRIEYLGLSIFHKIHVGETRPFMLNQNRLGEKAKSKIQGWVLAIPKLWK